MPEKEHTHAGSRTHSRRRTLNCCVFSFCLGVLATAAVLVLTPVGQGLVAPLRESEAATADSSNPQGTAKRPAKKAEAPSPQIDPMAELRRVQEINARNRRLTNPGPRVPQIPGPNLPHPNVPQPPVPQPPAPPTPRQPEPRQPEQPSRR